jgi:hypothetical protein
LCVDWVIYQLVALDVVEGAATGVNMLRLSEGCVTTPGITQNCNGDVPAVVSMVDKHSVR